MKFIQIGKKAIAVSALIICAILSNAMANDSFFTIENVSPDYLLEDGNKFTIVEYFEKNPPKVSFSKNFEGFTCSINKIKCFPETSYSLKLKGSGGPEKFYLKFTKGKINKIITIQVLPDDFSAYMVVGQSKLKDNIIFSRTPLDKKENILPSTEVFNLWPNGKIYFYKKMNFSLVDFKPHLIDGKLYYSYLRSEASFTGATIVGKRELLNDKLQLIKKFPEVLDMHEFILLGLDWYIGTRYSLSKTELGTDYINQEFLEIKDGTEIYRWSISELYKQFFISVGIHNTPFYDKNPVHQFHLNGLQLLPDNEILISLAYDGIIIIDKPTKKIKMVLGGPNDQFSLTPEQKIVFIHTPYFDVKNQVMTVFHNDLFGKSFKVLEYSINRSLKKVNKFSVLNTSNMISLKMGSVEKNGDIYSISNGYKRDAGPSFIEQTSTKRNMKITFKNVNAFIYRTYRAFTP